MQVSDRVRLDGGDQLRQHEVQVSVEPSILFSESILNQTSMDLEDNFTARQYLSP
jgi:hypothetical protein